MELHDASSGTTLWRAEARYADRAAPVETEDTKGRPNTEFLTVVRLYLEAETSPRLMIVHCDTQPNGLKSGTCAKSLAVYMLDPNAGYKPPSAPGAASSSRGDVSHEEMLEQFDFAALPAGEDIFQLSLNPAMTTVSLAALRLPIAEELEASLAAKTGVKVPQADVRTLARLKVGSEAHSKRKLEVDGGLDLPLVTMLLCATDQLLLNHEAIDYDVNWPEDYGFAHGECLSSRKKEAMGLQTQADFSVQTDSFLGDQVPRKGRSCFCF